MKEDVNCEHRYLILNFPFLYKSLLDLFFFFWRENLYLISSIPALEFERWFILLHPWTHFQSPSIPTSALKKSYSLSLSDFSFNLSVFSIFSFIFFELFRFVSNLSGSSILEIAALLTNVTVSPPLVLFHILMYSHSHFSFSAFRFWFFCATRFPPIHSSVSFFYVIILFDIVLLEEFTPCIS